MSRNEEFISFMSRAVSELGQDVKILFEMLDDPDFSDDERLRVAGALLYLLAPGDLVPDTYGLLGHTDDSLVFRMTMARCLTQSPARKAHYGARYPEVFEPLDGDLEVCAAFLGELYEWLQQWLLQLGKQEYKGKRAEVFLDDLEEGSWLYDEVNEALLDLEFDEDDLNRELRRIDRILPVMREKMEARRR